MIVVAIIAGLVAIGVPRLANQKGRMRSEVQRIAVLSREVFNAARLQNRTFRIVFEMGQSSSKFYVESANGQIALLNEAQQKDLDEKTSMDKEELAKLNPNKFEIETKYVKKPEDLPGDLRVEAIEYAGRTEPLESPDGEGVTKATVHYFPQGLAEHALIRFTDGKTLVWTLVVNPLTGKATVFDKKLTLKDIAQ